jgi:hypothetical protein
MEVREGLGHITYHSVISLIIFIVGMGANSIRFYNILSACIATGEYEKVANGIKKHAISR